MPVPARPVPERFWEKVDRKASAECWLWLGTTRNGYGQIHVGQYHLSAHRLAYELLIGPIPDGLTLDHLCRVTRCVNPSHLEPVTDRVNILRGNAPPSRNARKSHCLRGHLFDEANTRIRPNGARICRACHLETQRQWRLRRRQDAAA